MNRRQLIFQAPLSLAALTEFASALPLEEQNITHVDRQAAAFWIHGMGVPAQAIGPIEKDLTRGGTLDLGPQQGNFAREPVFLHYDETAQSLVLADQVAPDKLLASGDTQLSVQLQRLRLNPQDHQQFANYTSGGIYMEMQQQESKEKAASAAISEGQKRQQESPALQLASTLFSAFFPHSGGKGAGGKGSGRPKSSAGKTRGGTFGFLAEDVSPAQSVPNSVIPLQQGTQAQSLALSNGFGKAAFLAFVKDRRKSAFGQFISALVAGGGSPYAQLLSIPLMAVPALDGVRSVVASLQLGKNQDSSDQQPVLQSPPKSVAATAAALQNADSDCLRFRTGSYIAVPQEQAATLQGQLDKYMLLNGFLVPKGTGELSLYNAVQNTLPDLTYLSVGVNVKPTNLQNCKA